MKIKLLLIVLITILGTIAFSAFYYTADCTCTLEVCRGLGNCYCLSKDCSNQNSGSSKNVGYCREK